jgi:hypothetical protein
MVTKYCVTGYLNYMHGSSPLDWFMQEKLYWNNLVLKFKRDKVRPIAIISISGYKNPPWNFLAEGSG